LLSSVHTSDSPPVVPPIPTCANQVEGVAEEVEEEEDGGEETRGEGGGVAETEEAALLSSTKASKSNLISTILLLCWSTASNRSPNEGERE
jgi:hypothetical protein